MRTRARLTMHDFDNGRQWHDNTGATLTLATYDVVRTDHAGHRSTGDRAWMIDAFTAHGPYTQVVP